MTTTFPRRELSAREHEARRAALLRELADAPAPRHLPSAVVVAAAAAAVVVAVVVTGIGVHHLGRPEPGPASGTPRPSASSPVTGDIYSMIAEEPERFLSVARDRPVMAVASGSRIELSDAGASPGAARPQTSFVVPGARTISLALSPDATVLVTAGTDGVVRLWRLPADLSSGRPTLVQTLPKTVAYLPDLAFSADGSLLVVPGYDRQTGLFRVAGQRLSLVRTVQTPGALDPIRHAVVVTAVSFSPDGRYLAVADLALVSLMDLETNYPGTSSPEIRGNSSVEGRSVSSLAFSPDGRLLAVASDQELQVWDVTDHDRLHPWARIGSGGDQLAFGPHSDELAALDTLGRLRAWDVSTDGRTRVLTTPAPDQQGWQAIAVGPAGNIVLGRQLVTVNGKPEPSWWTGGDSPVTGAEARTGNGDLR